MSRFSLLAATAALAIAAAPQAVFAEAKSVDAGIGTTGIGVNASAKLLPWVAVRGGYNYLQFELDEMEYDGIEYDTEIDFSTFGGFVDIHPFRNGFTLTGGVYQGNKEVMLDATPDEPVEIGNLTFTPEQVGTLIGTVALEDTAPYLGIGWDGALYSESMINFWVRAGVMFTGSPEIALDASGGILTDDPVLQAEIQREVENLEEEVDDYEYYPVINLGVAFRF